LLLNAVLLCAVLLRRPAMIDIAYSPGPQQQTRRTLLQRSIDGTAIGNQMDGLRTVT